MKRVKKFGVYQTAKVAGIIYFLVTLVFVVPILFLFSLFGGDTFPASQLGGGGVFLLFVPFIYGIAGFIGAAISCAIYNLVSGWVGGIEVEIETESDDFDSVDGNV